VELGKLQFYFRKKPIAHASTKIFGGFGFFYFVLIAKIFEKMSKMKLLRAFQLAT